MKPIPTILTAAAAFALGFAAHRIPPDIQLDASQPPRVLSTFQRGVDAAFTDAMRDARLSHDERLTAVASRIEFDALCNEDERFGTREAVTFFNEELARNERLLQTMSAHRSRHD